MFARYVTGRLVSRLATSWSAAMTMFVLVGGVGVTGTVKVWIAGIVAMVLLAASSSKAIFDWVFEASGFVFGQILFRLPPKLRTFAALCGGAEVICLLFGRPLWFICACLILTAFDFLMVVNHTFYREPRLMLMPFKGSVMASAAVWGWGTGWMLAIVSYIVARRAFLYLLEGLTICAAEAQQRIRDQRAAALFESLSSAKNPGLPREKIVLYLRPFSIAERFKLDEGAFVEAVDRMDRRDHFDPRSGEWLRTYLPLLNLQIGIQERVSLLEQNSDFETDLEQALRGADLFIGLGRPGEALGAGRLRVVEARWRESVLRLLDAANLCIIVPSAQSGTQFEIRQVVAGRHLEKCCILMPPAVGNISFANEWKAARLALADILPLPEYHANGTLLRYSSDTCIAPRQPFETKERHGSRKELLACKIQGLFPELEWLKGTRQRGVAAGLALEA